jgi:hypothetical protein
MASCHRHGSPSLRPGQSFRSAVSGCGLPEAIWRRGCPARERQTVTRQSTPIGGFFRKRDPRAGLGTVSEVLLSFPEQFNDLAPSTGAAVSYNITWKNVPDNSWFGVVSDDVGFFVGQLPVDFIPPLDTAKFTTGLFDTENLPVAIGAGEGHAPGIVPDPGELGDPEEYLGRDMDWHYFDEQRFYQPRVPQPSITLIAIGNTTATVTIRSSLPGSLLFYRAYRPITFTETLFGRRHSHY